MSLALIEESAKEVRRLAIAGSPLAVGDFRLKKLIPALEQAGAKVPVFTQVAKAISDLVNGTDSDSGPRLLSLSTLLNAILYTQGHSGSEAAYRDLELCVSSYSSTRTTARVLKPLVQALTTTGGGRYEMVKTAFESGSFNDLRLIDPAIHALGDTYPELADFVADKVLPGYGPGIVPRLKETLNLKGKKQDARRLKVMHQLDPAGTLFLCKTVLEEGSPEVKETAVACLGKHWECLPLILEQANGKNKAVRAAALEALAEHDQPEISKLFDELLKGKALDILARPFRVMRSRQVLNSLFAEGRRVFELLMKGDQEQMSRFSEILDCLQQRRDAETEEFLLGCFERSEKPPKLKNPKSPFIVGFDLPDRLAGLVYEQGSRKALESILAKRDVLPVSAFTQVLYSALRVWPPERVYEGFAPFLGEKKSPGKEKSAIIQHTIRVACQGYASELADVYGASPSTPEAEALRKVEWDSRWLDAAIKAEEQVIVCCLARPDHKGAINYLLKRLDEKKQPESGLIIRTLARCQYPKLTEVFLDQVSKRTKGARFFDYELQLLFESARHLPVKDLPKLDAFAANLDEKFVDKYLEALEPLRSTKSD